MKKSITQINKSSNSNSTFSDAVYEVAEYLVGSDYVITVRKSVFPISDHQKSREEAYRWLYHQKKVLCDNSASLPEENSLGHVRVKNGRWEIQLLLLVNRNNQVFHKDDRAFFEHCDAYLLEGADKDEVTKGRAYEAKLFKKRYGISKLQYSTKVAEKPKVFGLGKIKFSRKKISKLIKAKKIK